MKIEVDIRKKYFFVFSIVVAVLIGAFFVFAYNPSGTGGVPSVMGHSVDEMDWSQQIQGDVKLSGEVEVNGQKSLRSDVNYISVGDLVSGDGTRGLILRAGDADRVTVTQAGDVAVEQGTLNVNNGNLNVLNGNLYVSGKISDGDSCEQVFDSVNCPASGEMDVPTECINAECLIFIWITPSRYFFAKVRQESVDIPSRGTFNVWTSSATGESDWDTSSKGGAGFNGDVYNDVITRWERDGWSVNLRDDRAGVEENPLKWSWDCANNDNHDFKVYVCE